MKRLRPTTRFSQNLLLIILGILFYTLINNLSMVTSAFRFGVELIEPLIIGAILAFFMNVPMRGLERLFARGQLRRHKAVHAHRNATLALVLTYLGTLGLIFLLFYIVVPQFASTVPAVTEAVGDSVPRLLEFLQQHNINTTSLEALISRVDLATLLNQILSNLQRIIGAISSLANMLTLAVTGIVISVYILANKQKLQMQVRRLLYACLPKRLVDRLVEIGILTNRTFSSFISCQCLEALILGILFFIAMSILRLPFAMVISVVIAFTALIPYVGALLGCVIGALLILMVSPMQALIFVVLFLVLQQLEDQLIYPRIVGSSVGLSPLWILVALFAGGKLFGVVGMLFFIPLASVLYSILKNTVSRQLDRKGLVIEPDRVVQATPAETEGEAQ